MSDFHTVMETMLKNKEITLTAYWVILTAHKESLADKESKRNE